MTKRDDPKSCIIYPENYSKSLWDVWITFVLVLCVFWTPWEMAFNIEHPASTVFNWIVDVLFLIDMIIVFFSAFTTEDFEVIDDHATIACIYIKGWFWIDLLAILPFRYMMPRPVDGGATSSNFAFVRIIKLQRLSKLFKILKLFRVVKFFKNSKYMHNISKSVMQAGIATERMILFMLVCFFGFHLCNCLWLWSAMFFEDSYEHTWISFFEYEEISMA